MRQGHVQTAGARLFWREDPGPTPDAPALLLLNSLAADHSMWDGQVALLTRRYRLIRYDTRGHGRSEAPEAEYSFAMLVRDAVAVLDAVGAARASVMGLSLGGMTALGLAIYHSSQVERLVCCDARADAPEPFVRSWDERLAALRAGGMQALLPGTLERWLNAGFRAASPAEVERVSEMILATPPAGYAGCAAALKRLDYLRDLHRIAVPALFVCGAEDAAAPPAVMREMAERTPGAQFAEVPRAAHLPNIDNADGFAEAVSDFLGLR
jgi:3-oxoadipate enol-lactonase